jgi:hypothetical protein
MSLAVFPGDYGRNIPVAQGQKWLHRPDRPMPVNPRSFKSWRKKLTKQECLAIMGRAVTIYLFKPFYRVNKLTKVSPVEREGKRSFPAGPTS